MPGLRFATVRDLYEAFPAARQDVGVEPSDEPSAAFLNRLVVAGGAFAQAITYCSYLLPRREAVWWGCESPAPANSGPSARGRGPARGGRGLGVRARGGAPDRGAQGGNSGDSRSPATWMALAAAGQAATPSRPIADMPAPPDQTARALRAGLLIALAGFPSGNRRSPPVLPERRHRTGLGRQGSRRGV